MLINVIGFVGGSGSLLDCMRKDQRLKVIPVEINFISDPTGIVNLFEKLCIPNDFNSKAYAIENFIKLLNLSFRNHLPKFRYGQNLGQFSNSKIDDEIILLLHQLKIEQTNLNSRVDFYNLNFYQYWIKIIKNLLNINEQKFTVNYPIDRVHFRDVVTKFLEKIFEVENTYTVLDQGLRIEHLSYNDVIFNNMKTIIINRNPKDIYSEQIRGNFLFGANPTNENINSFCTNYSIQFSLAKKALGKNIAMYDFEDLVLEQEATLQKIAQFLNVQSLDLDPNYLSDSRKNINIFHSNLTQGQSDLIDQNINYIKQINIEALL